MDINKRRARDTKTMYKATLSNYDEVFALSAERNCYSLSEQEIALIHVAIEMFGWSTRWYSNFGTSIDVDRIQALVGSIAHQLMYPSGECGGGDTIIVEGGCVIGQIVWLPVSVAPTGMLRCDGSNYLKADYPDLWAFLSIEGTKWQHSSDRFKVPEIRGKFIAGSYDTPQVGLWSPTMGAAGGEAEHTLTIDEMPEHSHVQTYAGNSTTPYSHSVLNRSPGIILQGGETMPEGLGQAHNNLPPFVALAAYIVAECESIEIPPPVIPEFRFDGCTLQFNSGSGWQDVLGWNELAPTCFKGDTGEQGVPGIPGEQGIPGIPGEQGIPGADGVDGKDADCSCRLAKSFGKEWPLLIAAVVDAAMSGSGGGYLVAKAAAAAVWPFVEGFEFDVAFDACWNEGFEAMGVMVATWQSSLFQDGFTSDVYFALNGCDLIGYDTYETLASVYPEDKIILWLAAAIDDDPRAFKRYQWDNRAYIDECACDCSEFINADCDFRTEACRWYRYDAAGVWYAQRVDGYGWLPDELANVTWIETQADYAWLEIEVSFGTAGSLVVDGATFGGTFTELYRNDSQASGWTIRIENPTGFDRIVIETSGTTPPSILAVRGELRYGN